MFRIPTERIFQKKKTKTVERGTENPGVPTELVNYDIIASKERVKTKMDLYHPSSSL